MKKQYLYSLVALVMAICGFTAWSSSGGINLLADSAEMTLQLDKFVPAENGSVKGMSYILFTFGENDTDIQVNPAFTGKTLGNISVPNANGTYTAVEKITSSDVDRFDHQIDGKPVAANQIVYHLANPISVEEAAAYHIAFANNVLISASGATNPIIKYDWTILPASTEPEPLTINTSACTPAEGSVVYGMSYIILTFGEDQTDIKLNPDYTGTNVGFLAYSPSGSTVENFRTANAADFLTHEVAGEPLAANQIAIKLAKPIPSVTFKQAYQVVISKGAFISGTTGGVLDTSTRYAFTLTVPPLEERPIVASDPANGATVSGPVDIIILTGSADLDGFDKNYSFVGDPGAIVNVATNEVVENLSAGYFDYEIDEEELPTDQLAYFLDKPLEAGTYKFSIASGVLKNKNYQNAPYEFTFTVIAPDPDPITLNTAACFPAEGELVADLTHIILTFGEKDTDIKVNPDYTSTNIGFIRQNNNMSTMVDFKTADAATYLTHEIDGVALADNQIGIILDKTLTEATTKTCELILHKNSLISGATGGVLENNASLIFTLRRTLGALVPIVSTIPANGAKVEAPVTELIFNTSFTTCEKNNAFAGDSKVKIVNAKTGEVVEDTKGSLTYKVNGTTLDDNQYAYILATPLEAGTYTVYLADRVFYDTKGDKDENAAYEFTFTVVDDLNAPVETFDFGFTYSSYGVTNNYDYSFRRVKFNTNVTFLNVPAGFTIDPELTPVKWVRESDGTVVTADVINFMDTPMMLTESAKWPSSPGGVWTCVLPQGLIQSGDKVSVEKTLKVTWDDPNAEPPRPAFEVTKFNFLNTPDAFNSEEGQPDGVPADMMFTLWQTAEGGESMLDWETNPKSIASLNMNRGFVINTTWDQWIQCFIAEVKRKDGTGEIDTWNQETIQEIYGYGNYPKNYVGSSVSDCVPYQHPMLGCGGNEDTREYAQDVVYTFDIWFYDSLIKRSYETGNHQNACGSYHFEFTGATAPFVYSQIAKLVSISPAPTNATELGLPAETPGVVKGINAPIVFTWSAPVTMTAKYSMGSESGLVDAQSCVPNADRTVWIVVPGEACIYNGEDGYLDVFEFDVQAIDAEGHYVKGNVGTKRNTMFVPSFNFEDVETGLNALDAENLSVVSANGSINVLGIAEGMTVSLYTLEGLEMAKVVAADSTVEFANVLPGAYLIVVTDGEAQAAVKLLHK